MATTSMNGYGEKYDPEESEVGHWYKSRRILVTGGTGFLGKVLVERILRVCPPEKLYLMLRPKKGKDMKERLEDFLNCQIFDGLRDLYPDRLGLVCGVKGDVLLEDLGISLQDRQELIQECGVVFHCAANVRFDQTIKNAVITNTLGTRKLLELTKQMQKLDAFVHVSTAYCHCDQTVLEEVSYAAPQNPNKIIDLVSWMDQDILTTITPQLLGNLPNTYAYSKSLSEEIVANHSKYFPVVIARPSIVVATWQDPIPGWIENLNGPTGLLVGAGKGVIRSMHCKGDYNADLMPVDICVNALVALGWKAGTTKPIEPMVCNVTESGDNPITWKDTLSLGKKHVYQNPFSLILWFPGGSIKSSWLAHIICVIFFHIIPAYLIDLLLVLFRNKPFMVKTQKRISEGLNVLQYYTTREWVFKNERLRNIPDWLNEKDQKILYTNVQIVNWDKYMLQYVLGVREYCCKEDPATLPRARRLLNRLYYLDLLMSLLFYTCFAWFLWNYSTTILNLVKMFLGSTPNLLRSTVTKSI